MIPKVIHYCWFGRGEKPELAKKCIASWKMFLPDYEIKEWNEDNFDVNIIPYTAEAYSVKKYAFVSDYARFLILYKYGGLYFDTDVEVIKPLTDIINRGPFMGIETVSSTKKKHAYVAPGLGMGALPKMEFYKEILAYYNDMHFALEGGRFNQMTVGEHTTQSLILNGFSPENNLQRVAGIWIYPIDYFNPLDDATGKLRISDNTRSIHWYTKSWISNRSPMTIKLTRIIHRIIGVGTTQRIKKLLFKL